MFPSGFGYRRTLALFHDYNNDKLKLTHLKYQLHHTVGLKKGRMKIFFYTLKKSLATPEAGPYAEPFVEKCERAPKVQAF